MAKAKQKAPEVTELEASSIKGYIKNVEEDVMTGIASDESEDRDGEVISMDGWDLKDFKKNPVVLYGHNRVMSHNGLPIGKATDIGIKEIDGKRKLVFDFVIETITEFGRDVKQMVKEGFINTFSVGFMPLEREGNKFTKQSLLEISLVPVPSNSNALILQRAYDGKISFKSAFKVLGIKSVVKFKAMPLAPEGTLWNGQAAQSRMRDFAKSETGLDFTKYKEAFTWINKEAPERLASYKMPHHDVRDGEVVTVWKGVVSSMTALLRGSVDMSASDKKKAYNHLVKHYKEFGKEAPEFKYIEEQTFKEVFEVFEVELEHKYFKETKRALKEIRQEVKQNRSSEVKVSDAKNDPEDIVIALQALTKSVDLALEKTGK